MHLHITVVPASSRVGKEAIRQLLQSSDGPKVRGIYRNTSKAPSEFVEKPNFEATQGDVGAGTGIDFSGSNAVLYIPPPSFDGDDTVEFATKTANAVRDALRAAPTVKRLVLHSAVGAHHQRGTGILRLNKVTDDILGTSVSEVLIAKPGYYHETWVEALKTIRADSAFVESFLSPADHAIPMVGVKDIGEFCVKNLLAETSLPSTRCVKVFGPRLYSSNDILHAVEEISGRKGELRCIEPERLLEYFMQHMPRGPAEDMAEMIIGALPGGVLTTDFQHDDDTYRGTVELVDALREADRGL